MEDTEKCVPRAVESGLALERQCDPPLIKNPCIEALFCFLGVPYHGAARYIEPAKKYDLPKPSLTTVDISHVLFVLFMSRFL